MEERNGSGAAAIAFGLLIVVVLGFVGLFGFRVSVSSSPPPMTGHAAGVSATWSDHPTGEPASNEVRFQGAAGEVRFYAEWSVDGRLDAAASGLFVAGVRQRGLAEDEQKALFEAYEMEPGTDLPAALEREQ